MSVANLVGMVDASFAWMQSLGDWYKDPAGVAAVHEIRDRMVQDLESFGRAPSSAELAELCREWRAMRIEWDGEPSYPTDIFIEKVCGVIEIA